MPITYIGAGGTNNAKANGMTSITVSTGAVTAGQLVLLRMGVISGSATPLAVSATDDGGNTYTLLAQLTTQAAAHVYVLGAVAASGGTFTITAGLGSGANGAAVATDCFAGASLVEDVPAATASVATATLSVGPVVPTTNGCLLYGAHAVVYNSQLVTETSGFTTSTNKVSTVGGSAASNVTTFGSYFIQPTAASKTWTASVSQPRPQDNVLVVLRPDTGTPPPVVSTPVRRVGKFVF